MKTCDLCSAQIGEAQMRRLTASQMRTAARNDLQPAAQEFFLARALGLDEEAALSAWKQQVASDTTDWGLCPACYDQANRALGGGALPARLSHSVAPSSKAGDIRAFESFLGIGRTDRKAHIMQVYGKPSSYGYEGPFGWFDWLLDRFRYDFETMYYRAVSRYGYKEIIRFTYGRRTRKVEGITCSCDVGDVKTSIDFIRAFGVEDDKMFFLGKNREEIVAFFGQPENEVSDNLCYIEGTLQVNFICYDFHAKQCSSVAVSFFD